MLFSQFLTYFESRNGIFKEAYFSGNKSRDEQFYLVIAKQNIHSWMPFNHFKCPWKNRNTLGFIPRHYFPNPNSFIPTTRLKERTRYIPRHAFHFIFMTLESERSVPGMRRFYQTQKRQQKPTFFYQLKYL